MARIHVKVRGFTLIELLVVISIIALLMAILMPVLQKAKGAAKTIVCKSHMQQIGRAANLYAGDYESYIPRAELEAKTDKGIKGSTWYMDFMPYLSVKPPKLPNGHGDYRAVKIYRCPSFPDKEQTVCFVSNGWEPANKGQKGWDGGEQINGYTKLISYQNLGSTIYLADNEDGRLRPIVKEELEDGKWDWNDVHRPQHLPRITEAEYKLEEPQWNTMADVPRVARKRHGNGCNALFADWHVEWLARTKMGVTKKQSLNSPQNQYAISLWRFKIR